MSETTQLTGPAEEFNGDFWLVIPLEDGGGAFVECAKGISVVVDGCIKIFIARPIGEKMGIRDGSLVTINNEGRKLNIQLASPD